jgi:hypothetical protein
VDAVTRQVYADVAALEGVPFRFLNLGNRGMAPATWSDLDKVTPAGFGEAVADDIRWRRAGCPDDDARAAVLRKRPGASR